GGGLGLEEPGELRPIAADHTGALHADVPHAPALAVAQHGEVERHAVVPVTADDARLYDGPITVERVARHDDLLPVVTIQIFEVGAVQELAEERDERRAVTVGQWLRVPSERATAHLVPSVQVVGEPTR